MARYPATPAQPAAEPPFMVETSAPLRASRLESEVAVPFLHAAITALIVFISLALASVMADWPWEVSGIGFVVTLAGVWLWRLLRSDALMWRLERMTGHELTGDNVLGKPTMTVVNQADARAQAAQDNYNTVRATAAAQQSLIAFVHLCASVPKPTEKALGIPTGDRDGYVAYRTKLMQLGIARWDNPDNHDAGWHLGVTTETAARIIEQHLF